MSWNEHADDLLKKKGTPLSAGFGIATGAIA
jgi:hypothetical protein